MNTKTNQKKVLSTELFTGLFGHQKLTKKFMLSQTPTVPSDHQLKKKKNLSTPIAGNCDWKSTGWGPLATEQQKHEGKLTNSHNPHWRRVWLRQTDRGFGDSMEGWFREIDQWTGGVGVIGVRDWERRGLIGDWKKMIYDLGSLVSGRNREEEVFRVFQQILIWDLMEGEWVIGFVTMVVGWIHFLSCKPTNPQNN